MSMRIVVSQSMLFPWIGMLEQIRLADIFVHYDDVQFSKGGFTNRVQIKSPQGTKWMTVPLKNFHFGQNINEVKIVPPLQWRDKHMELLRKSFADAPFAADALMLAEDVYSREYTCIGALARASMHSLINYYSLNTGTRFIDIEAMCIPGSGSERVLSVVQKLRGDVYVTGHGATHYLDHERFECSGISVEYMNYSCKPYHQLFGEFTPYVTGLDLVANCGHDGVKYICSDTVYWRDFINGPA